MWTATEQGLLTSTGLAASEKTNLRRIKPTEIWGFSVAAAGFTCPTSSPFLFIRSVSTVVAPTVMPGR